MALLASVNLARSTREVPYAERPTAIAKLPVDGPVEVRDPGAKGTGMGSGLVGDLIGDGRHHGGQDQAVYAVARERLAEWSERLGRPLADGAFGENLTTVGLDVDGALLGERWRVGADVVLQVTVPRVPCATFRGWMGERGWLKTFTADERPGAYLRVLAGGLIRSGDQIEIIHRPAHDVTISLAFRALVRDARLLPRLTAAGPDLVPDVARVVASGRTFAVDA
jgi:MOSC domain-containing protein YiiM